MTKGELMSAIALSGALAAGHEGKDAAAVALDAVSHLIAGLNVSSKVNKE